MSSFVLGPAGSVGFDRRPAQAPLGVDVNSGQTPRTLRTLFSVPSDVCPCVASAPETCGWQHCTQGSGLQSRLHRRCERWGPVPLGDELSRNGHGLAERMGRGGQCRSGWCSPCSEEPRPAYLDFSGEMGADRDGDSCQVGLVRAPRAGPARPGSTRVWWPPLTVT